jgi:hypothetical protein
VYYTIDHLLIYSIDTRTWFEKTIGHEKPDDSFDKKVSRDRLSISVRLLITCYFLQCGSLCYRLQSLNRVEPG